MKKLLLVLAAAAVLCFGFYIYTGTYGYPWKRAQIERDAVRHMEEKYGMEAKAVGSSFNFKFDTYMASVYDVRRGEEMIIRVERAPFYDEATQGRGERLEDNYGEVYWGRWTEERLQEEFPQIYGDERVREIRMSTVYHTLPPEEGVSAEKDANGVYVPEKPKHRGTWDIDLKSDDISDAFLQELYSTLQRMQELGLEADLHVTADRRGADSEEPRRKTKYLNAEYPEFEKFRSVEELRAAITQY